MKLSSRMTHPTADDAPIAVAIPDQPSPAAAATPQNQHPSGHNRYEATPSDPAPFGCSDTDRLVQSRGRRTLDSNLAMSSLRPGRPEVNYRPQQRELSTDPIGVIREWFEKVQLSAGDACITSEMEEKAMRLAYTWKDYFVMTMNELRQSDLVEHTIQLEPGAVPYRLRQPKYTPAERAFAARILICLFHFAVPIP